MTRLILLIAAAGFLAVPVQADARGYGWEDCGTVLGLYGSGEPPIIVTNVMAPDPVSTGLHSLKLEDNSASGTPQAYLAWITGLAQGDSVTGCFSRFDTTPGASPSTRIWGHYTTSDNIDNYQGSAGGNDDYGPGTGWDQVCHTWHFDDGGGTRDALVIEARTYSNPSDTVWIDDLDVEYPPTATLLVPIPGASATDAVSWTDVKELYRK
jgi:hypothetical protein